MSATPATQQSPSLRAEATTLDEGERDAAKLPPRLPQPRAAAGSGVRDRDLAAAAPYLADWEAFQRELTARRPAAAPRAASEAPESPATPATPAAARAAEAPEASGTLEFNGLRRAAIERFAVLGFPTTRQEEWRFTNLAPLARAAFRRPLPLAAAAAASRISPADFAPWTFDAAARLVFVDGRLAPELSDLGSAPAAGSPLPPGIVVESLAVALAREPRLLAPYLGRFASFAEQPFVALNTAFLEDGALVMMPRGAVLERPIHLLYLSTAGGAGEAAAAPGAAEAAEDVGRAPALVVSYPRTLIVAGEGSQLTVVETYAGQGAYFSCGVTELVAGAGAVIDHYKVQRESRDAYHLATLQVYGERASNISSHSISLGGGLVRNDVNALLDGEGIECILNGLYLADGRQLVDNHMRVEHAKPHCASHELYKGILDGRARSVFNGLIHVHPGAQKTDAKQSNRNLLLSPEAIANSNPRLEIFADDVKCTHGSTVGQLDDDAIFYLRSRGIGLEAARSLLTYAFASDILGRIKVEPVRHDLEEYLFARLPQGEVVRQAV
jgi:Fe-S cluster assembly protein SufD